MAAIMSIRGELWKGRNVAMLLEVEEKGGRYTLKRWKYKLGSNLSRELRRSEILRSEAKLSANQSRHTHRSWLLHSTAPSAILS
eukprot:scaffold14678_cov75-Skeletonema_dohrnii-CCMP3373.AAC.2